MPRRCLVFSFGTNFKACSTSCLLSSFGSPKIEPMPMASKFKLEINLADSSRSSLNLPPWMMPYNAWDLSLFNLLNVLRLRWAQAWVRVRDALVVL